MYSDLSPPGRSATDEERLLERISAGDTEAFRLLVGQHVDRSYVLALRVLRSDRDAERVVEHVFATIWSQAPIGRPFSVWLYKTLIEHCRLQQQATLAGPPGTEVTSAAALVARTALTMTKETKALETAMAELPEALRILLTLTDSFSLDLPEVAAVLGVDVEAATRSRRAGRQQLRRILRGRSEAL